MSVLDKDAVTVYTIPENFIDEGRIIKGMFKTRNFVEGIIMALAVAVFANMIPADEMTVKITIMVAFCGPFFMLGISGFNGDSVFQTAKNAYHWAKARTILLYNGNARALSKSPLESMMEQEAPGDMLLNYMEQLKQKRIEKRAATALVEGVNFEFEEDADLVGIYADEDTDEDEPADKEPVSKTSTPTTQASLDTTTVAIAVDAGNADSHESDQIAVDTEPVVHIIPVPTSDITTLNIGDEPDNNEIKQPVKTFPTGTGQVSIPLKTGVDISEEDLF